MTYFVITYFLSLNFYFYTIKHKKITKINKFKIVIISFNSNIDFFINLLTLKNNKNLQKSLEFWVYKILYILRALYLVKLYKL